MNTPPLIAFSNPGNSAVLFEDHLSLVGMGGSTDLSFDQITGIDMREVFYVRPVPANPLFMTESLGSADYILQLTFHNSTGRYTPMDVLTHEKAPYKQSREMVKFIAAHNPALAKNLAIQEFIATGNGVIPPSLAQQITKRLRMPMLVIIFAMLLFVILLIIIRLILAHS